MDVLRYEYRKPDWLCFFELRVTDRVLSYRSAFAGDYFGKHSPRSRRFAGWPLRPSVSRMWHKREYASAAEAKRELNATDLCDLRPILGLPNLGSLDISETGAEEENPEGITPKAGYSKYDPRSSDG